MRDGDQCIVEDDNSSTQPYIRRVTFPVVLAVLLTLAFVTTCISFFVHIHLFARLQFFSYLLVIVWAVSLGLFFGITFNDIVDGVTWERVDVVIQSKTLNEYQCCSVESCGCQEVDAAATTPKCDFLVEMLQGKTSGYSQGSG